MEATSTGEFTEASTIASVDVTSSKAFMEDFMAVMEVFADVMKAFTEVTCTDAFVEAFMVVMEAFHVSKGSFRGSYACF